MSIINSAKEFFGLGPVDPDAIDRDDAYYADDHQGRSVRAERGIHAAHGSYGDSDRYGYEATRDGRHTGVLGSRSRVEANYEPTIVAISLDSYNDALKIGDPYRDGDVVVYEVTDASRADAMRLIDFGVGLSYGSRGEFIDLAEKLDTDRLVFAVVPHGVEVSTVELEQAARLR